MPRYGLINRKKLYDPGDCRNRIHRLGHHRRLQAAYRLARMGAHLLDAVGADAYCGGELEYRTGVGSRGPQQSGRARHSHFCPSLSHGPVQLYRDSRSLFLRFGATHRPWLLDLAPGMVAKIKAAGIGRGSRKLTTERVRDHRLSILTECLLLALFGPHAMSELSPDAHQGGRPPFMGSRPGREMKTPRR
jgi:hypothetical protein